MENMVEKVECEKLNGSSQPIFHSFNRVFNMLKTRHEFYTVYKKLDKQEENRGFAALAGWAILS